MSGKLILITGLKGAAKTLWVVDQLFQEFEKKHFLHYFSDITALKHTGVQVAPEDWRDVPDQSLIVYDEVQFKLLFSRHNSKRDTQILELTTMRKRGIEIWLITQRARFLNADVLGLVDQHVQIERNGKKTSKVYVFQEAEMNITKTKKMFAFEKYVFAHPENLYGFYESVKEGVEHDQTRSWVNKNVVSIAITLIICSIAGIYFIYHSITNDGLVIKDVNQKQEVAKHDASKAQQQAVSQGALTAVQDKELQTKIDLCVKQFSWTVDQCKQAYDKKSEQARTDQLEKTTGNNMEQIVFKYNANKPFDNEYEVNAQPTDFPKFSGCMKKNGRYVAYTQQGTILNEVSASDCRRVIERGDRPFDYFKQQQQTVSQEKTVQQQDVNKDTESAKEMKTEKAASGELSALKKVENSI